MTTTTNADTWGLRFEQALERRKRAPKTVAFGAICEACGDRIPRYIGPERGILCSGCLKQRPLTCSK